MAGIAIAVAAMVVKRYMKKLDKKDKRNRQTDVNLWYHGVITCDCDMVCIEICFDCKLKNKQDIYTDWCCMVLTDAKQEHS